MSIPHLTTYLNDHLAASVMAIDMIAFAAARSEGTPLGSFLTQLHSEIEEDQTVVRNLLERLDVSENPVKKATAWVAEKVSRLKLEASDTSDPLARLQALETLQIGILGVRSGARSRWSLATSGGWRVSTFHHSGSERKTSTTGPRNGA